VRWTLVLIPLASCSARLRTGAELGPDAVPDAPVRSDADGDASVAVSPDARPPDAGSALTGSQFVGQYDVVYCNAAFACAASFPGSAFEFTVDFGTSTSQCVQLAQQYDVPATIDADIASGLIDFDPTLGTACLAGLGYDCATLWQQGLTNQATCAAAMIGKVPDGGACHVDWDCAWTSGCNAFDQCQPY